MNIRLAGLRADFEERTDARLAERLKELLEFAPQEERLDQEFPHLCAELLSTLTPREAQILRLRFGIGVSEELSYEEIARRMNIAEEIVEQIAAKGLRKLRHPSRSERLRNYLESE